jgi:hypothetical protein
MQLISAGVDYFRARSTVESGHNIKNHQLAGCEDLAQSTGGRGPSTKYPVKRTHYLVAFIPVTCNYMSIQNKPLASYFWSRACKGLGLLGIHASQYIHRHVWVAYVDLSDLIALSRPVPFANVVFPLWEPNQSPLIILSLSGLYLLVRKSSHRAV